MPERGAGELTEADVDQHQPDGPGAGGRPPALRTLDAAPFADGFRETLERRPALSVAGVLAAASGALLGLAAVYVVGLDDDPSPWLLVLVGLVLVAAGWATAFVLRLSPPSGPAVASLVPGGTVLALLGVFAGVSGLVAEATVDTIRPSESIAWWPAVLAAVALASLWVAPGLQGRPALLTAALLSGTWAVGAFVLVQLGGDGARSTSEGFVTPVPFSLFGTTDIDDVRAAALAVLGLGLVFLVVAAVVDRLGLPGLGTPFVIAGVAAGIVGSSGVLPDNQVLRVLAPLLVVVLVGAVGVLGRRKATTWVAGLALVPLLVQLTGALLGDGATPGLVSLVLALFGLLLLIGAVGAVFLGVDDPARTRD